MQTIDFYQSHLDRVSRSFAFCIQKLEQPFRLWVSMSYLLCRILDTVEDAVGFSHEERQAQYGEFISFIEARPSRMDVIRWASRFPATIPQGERALLQDAPWVFEDLHDLPPRVIECIRSTVLRMCEGMRYYSGERSSGTGLKLRDLRDVNRYCYFVAGIVGELLSRLLLERHPDYVPGKDFLKNAFHFGLFLQKVNLLKDQLEDEREGRFLVPDRKELLTSLRANAIGAYRYISALPQIERGYRVFCAWSLFLGAASLPWIERSFKQGDGTKIPRSVTQELLEEIEGIAMDNDAMGTYLDLFLKELPEEGISQAAQSPEDSGWFEGLSGNILDATSLAELELV